MKFSGRFFPFLPFKRGGSKNAINNGDNRGFWASLPIDRWTQWMNKSSGEFNPVAAPGHFGRSNKRLEEDCTLVCMCFIVRVVGKYLARNCSKKLFCVNSSLFYEVCRRFLMFSDFLWNPGEMNLILDQNKKTKSKSFVKFICRKTSIYFFPLTLNLVLINYNYLFNQVKVKSK